MKITENLELEQSDLERILSTYLRSYRFYNKGRTPEKIILPKLSEIKLQIEKMPPEFVTIPVVYVGKEGVEDDIADRPQRARRDYKVSKPVGSSSSDKPQPDK